MKGSNSNILFKRIAPGELVTGKFSKIFFFGVLLHIDKEGINEVLENLRDILNDDGRIVFIEPVYKKEEPLGDMVLYRTHDNFVEMFNQAGFRLVKNQNVLRSPSYSFGVIKKLKIKSKLFLPFYRKMEEWTINRKPEHANFFWELFVFEKKK